VDGSFHGKVGGIDPNCHTRVLSTFFPPVSLPLAVDLAEKKLKRCTTDDLRNSRILRFRYVPSTHIDLRDYLFQEDEEEAIGSPEAILLFLSEMKKKKKKLLRISFFFCAAMFFIVKVFWCDVMCVCEWDRRVGGGQGHEAHLSHLLGFLLVAGCPFRLHRYVLHLDPPTPTKVSFFFLFISSSSLAFIFVFLSIVNSFHPSRKNNNVYVCVCWACFVPFSARFADFQGYLVCTKLTTFGFGFRVWKEGMRLCLIGLDWELGRPILRRPIIPEGPTRRPKNVALL
jgi:hypothetical protein